MYVYPEKIGLSVVEAGWLLQKSEGRVRGMLSRGELRYAVDGRKVDPESVAELIESGLAGMLLRRLLVGAVAAPRPERRWGPPRSLFAGLDALMVAAPALVANRSAGRVEFVPRLGDAGDSPAGAGGKELSLTPILSFLM